MAVVVGVKMVGEAYHNGRRCPGFGQVRFDNGSTMYVSEANCIGLEGCLNMADNAGHDTRQFRRDLKVWVKTGRFPNAKQPA